MSTIYDENVQFYLDFIDRDLAGTPSFFGMLTAALDDLIGHRSADARVLDLACGEGYLSRHFAENGAHDVIGIDISSELIAAAQDRTALGNVTFRVDDAQVLDTMTDGSIDLVVSQFALMDIPDHRATFAAVRRVLAPTGVFAFSILHPCFEGPFEERRDRPRFLMQDDVQTALIVHEYVAEGRWFSGGQGVRGRVGSYHRMLSTYLNDLMSSGFRIAGFREPVMPGTGLFERVPRALVVAAEAE